MKTNLLTLISSNVESSNNSNNLVIIIVSVVTLLVIILLISIFILIKKNNKKETVHNVSPELLAKILNIFGGAENILDIDEDGSRVKFEILDIKNCHLEELKSLAKGGVFISNNQVKLMFDVDNKTLKNQLKALIDD